MDTVLYYGRRFARLQLDALDGARIAEDNSVHVSGRRVVAMGDLGRAMSYLERRPVDAVLVDATDKGELERAHELLARLFPHGRISGPIMRQRIVALVAEDGVQDAFELGRHGISGVLVGPDAGRIDAHLRALLSARGHGKVAVCLAGGGIEGLLYEIGVLRALEDCMVGRSVVDVDFFCGISAGAILGSLLANGVGPHEILRALEGDSRRLEPIGKWDLFEPNVSEIASRLFGLARELVRGGEGPRGAVSSLTRAIPSAAFSGRRLGQWLERQLGDPAMSDDFRALRRPLYVGATDQDTARPVLFGDGELCDVPVHRAVHASCALVPFYPPVEVDGRLYIDGAFSRTTNMRVAARKGATLIILIDPLVPVRSGEAGYVHARGGIYAVTQGLKALINGRFDKAVRAIGEMHPDVAFHLFRPEADEMRILSGSPMKVFYRREVAEIAYEATLEKIRDGFGQFARDFALHGIELADPDGGQSVMPPPRTGYGIDMLGIA